MWGRRAYPSSRGGGHSDVKERPCDGSRRHDILCVLGREVKGGRVGVLEFGTSDSEWGGRRGRDNESEPRGAVFATRGLSIPAGSPARGTGS